jgi:DNA polymerase III sliding clamp (beta) subunit (PCNA family)
MKFTIKDFTKELKALERMLEKKGSGMPARQYFLFEAIEGKNGNGKLIVTASNQESGVTQEFPAKVETPGELLVPPVFSQVVGGLSDVIRIHVKEGRDEMDVEAGTFNGPIKGMVADDYPKPPNKGKKNTLTLTVAALIQLLGVGPFAVQKNSGQILEAICLSWKPDKEEGVMRITSRATDSQMLATTTVKAKGISEPKQILISRSFLETMRPVINQSKEVKFFDKPNCLMVGGDGITAWQSFVAGRYPDFSSLMRQRFYKCPSCNNENMVPPSTTNSHTCEKCSTKNPLDEIEFKKQILGAIDGEELKDGLTRIHHHIRASTNTSEGGNNNSVFSVKKTKITCRYFANTKDAVRFDFRHNSEEAQNLDVGFSISVLASVVDSMCNVAPNSVFTTGFTSSVSPFLLSAVTDQGTFLSMVMPVILATIPD